jgi:aldose 1-epimerase
MYRAADGTETSVFRGTPEKATSALDHSTFPMVPYCNRIRGGAFTFREREVRIAPNMKGDPSPLHGDGWLAEWEVVRLEAAQAEIRYVHSGGEWPWRYEARQTYALDKGGLTLVLSCTNLSDEPMPCGLGHHPYFTCTPQTRIDVEVECAWTIDEDVLPVDKVPAEGRYDLRNRLVCGQDLDNGFGGFGGVARIEDPSLPFRIEIRSDAARFFQLYSPKQGGIFVAEPVSHANAALNEPEDQWEKLGLRVLAPRETLRLPMRVEVIPVQ